MFQNQIKPAWRSLRKNKATFFINLFGLSIGMTAAVFIFLWVQNEITHDDYQPDKDNIFLVANTIHVNQTDNWIWEGSPMLMAETAQKEIPNVQKTARALFNSYGTVFTANHKLFSEKSSAYVDDSWFHIFHYDFLYGNATSFEKNPWGVILTESKAKKYFGDANAVGKFIKSDTLDYRVEGVIKDNPINSSFTFDIILQMQGRLLNPQVYKNDKSWNNFGYLTFLELRPGSNIAAVSTQLNKIINTYRTNHNDDISLKPFNSLYFDTDIQSSDMPHGNKKAVYMFSILGLLLLIIATINYVNLTTAKASLRAKEVSVRKIVGASRGSLFSQFVMESILISFIAMMMTLALIELCLPLFNSVTEENFTLPIFSLAMWKVLGGTLLVTALLNGVYPAMLLSSFDPLNVFRGKALLRMRDGIIRKGLVVFQFALSVVLIVSTIVIYRQLKFIQSENPGYNVSQVMSIEIPWEAYGKMNDTTARLFYDHLKHELQDQSNIAAVSIGGDQIVNVRGMSSGNADWDGRDTAFNPSIAQLGVDADFKDMFQLQMAAGTWFPQSTQGSPDFILNETAVRELGIRKPIIGARFSWGSRKGKVIGVVKDFHYKSLHEKIGPMVLRYNRGEGGYIFAKTYPGTIPAAINTAQTIWEKYVPTEPFAYTFLDDSFNTLYKTDIKTSRLILFFSLIAIVICALGLFGLATFSAEQRVKEIGIRKVLGASVQQIVTLISKDFVMLVLIAIAAAIPVAGYFMSKWLQGFAYRIDLSAGIYIAAGVIAILIALLSVSAQAIKAAMANPVKSLRTE